MGGIPLEVGPLERGSTLDSLDSRSFMPRFWARGGSGRRQNTFFGQDFFPEIMNGSLKIVPFLFCNSVSCSLILF